MEERAYVKDDSFEIIRQNIPYYRALAEQAGFPEDVISGVLEWMQATGSTHYDSLEIHGSIYDHYALEVRDKPERVNERVILQSFATYQIDRVLDKRWGLG